MLHATIEFQPIFADMPYKHHVNKSKELEICLFCEMGSYNKFHKLLFHLELEGNSIYPNPLMVILLCNPFLF